MTAALRPPERVNLAGAETGRLHLSHSSLSTFLACEQRFFIHYERRLDPAVTVEPLAVGKAFAHALETGDPSGGAKLLRLHAEKEAERAAGNPWLTVPTENEVAKQAAIVGHAAQAYLAKYGSRGQTREVELRARIRNPAKGGRYSQTHDLVVRIDAVSNDLTALYEDKLVGQIPRASLAARVRLDRQVSIEAYMIWRCFGVLVDRIHYRLTLKPSIEQRVGRLLKDGSRKGAETFAEYLARIGEEYATRPEHYLVEEVATRTPDDFLRLEHELWRWAEQVRSARRDGVWPRNTGACHEYSGCRYLAICAREPGAAHQYVVRPERDETPVEVQLPVAA